MSTTLWLRIASVILLLFTVGHSLGGLQRWSPMGDNEVLRQMTAVRFDTMGASRTYLDFFMGFGWSISIVMLLQTVLLWQLSSLARTNATAVRPMIAAFVIATLATGVIAWRFLFPVPALFSAALVIALVVAYVTSRKIGPA
jgi:hypothetical protein